MVLDEAIKHCEEVAIDKTNLANTLWDSIEKEKCKECASEYRQFAEWLRDYKRLKEQEKRFKRYTMQDDMHLVTIRQVKEVMQGEWL